MTDAQAIRANGWRQGSVFRIQDHTRLGQEAGVAIPDEVRCLVISHSCDLVHKNLNHEPVIEVIIGTTVHGKPDGRMTFAKNPRILQIPLTLPEGLRYYEFRIACRCQADRQLLVELQPDAGCHLGPRILNCLQTWLANRYTREALPDAFNRRLTNAARQRIESVLKECGTEIDGVYIRVDPMTELDAKEIYRILVYALMDDETFNDSVCKERGWQTVEEIAKALRQCGMEVLDSALRSKSDFTVSEFEEVMKWNFDWISLEQESG